MQPQRILTKRIVLGLTVWLSHASAFGAGELVPEKTINWGESGPFYSIPSHEGDQFGYAMAPFGGNQFLVGIRLRGLGSGINYQDNVGTVLIYSAAGSGVGSATHPSPVANDRLGTAVTVVGTSIIASAPYGEVGRSPNEVTDAGVVYVFNQSGTYQRAISNPDPGDLDHFGLQLAALGTQRILIGTSDDDAGAVNAGTVYVYNLSGTRLATVNNPTPAVNDVFGFGLAPVGTDRFIVGAWGDDTKAVDAGRAYLYDLNGSFIKANIPDEVVAGDRFGMSAAAVGTNWYAVGAPYAEVLKGAGTIDNAGKVFLFDYEGNLQRVIPHPDPQLEDHFGDAIAAVGTDRILVAASFRDQSGQVNAGIAYLYNLQGDLLGTIPNPTPVIGDQFGITMAGISSDRFVIAAPYDDVNQNNAGSAYIYYAPIVERTIGSEIPTPNLGFVLQSSGPEIEPASGAYWHVASQILYATAPGPLLIRWKGINGETFNEQVLNVWPADENAFQIHVSNTPSVDLSGGGVYTHAELMTQESGVGASPSEVSNNFHFQAAGQGRSLLLVSSGNPGANPIFFQLVRSVVWNNPSHLINDAPATIGEEITEFLGYHDGACGAPYVYWPNSPYCPAPGFYDRSQRSGPIIPVNTDKPGEENDLVLICYQSGAKLKNGSGAAVGSTICWPWKSVRYDPAWPAATPNKIIIASQQGTGTIDPVLFKNWDIYSQNISNAPGFNPNDEHALRRPYGGGEAIFALRDDLGTPETSAPYVLMQYLDPSNGDRGRILAFKVVAEESPFFFDYPGTVATLVQPPFPLSTLQLCTESMGVSGPFWRDRNEDYWAKAAGNDGGSAEIVMRFYYPAQPTFYFPDDPQPALGTCVPWLDLRAGTPGVPMEIGYTIEWPEAPELRVRETLVTPKFGLPDIRSQTSVEIIYEQAQALGQGHSVRLIDPTREYAADLAQLPNDITTVSEAGEFFFPTLPPSLRQRLRYDPINHLLKFRGEFIEPPAGESYLLLNVITDREKDILMSLSANLAFQTALNDLAFFAAEPLQVPPAATAFDSLALTAGQADAPGFVTLAFGNNPNLSPPAEPVALQVIQVVCPVYRGEIKVIESGNPFDEQLTLRHSGDFAGQTDTLRFEWRTLPPVDGLPPAQPPDLWSPFAAVPASGNGAVDITIAGPGLQTLSDNYFICRYRRIQSGGICGDEWSEWTDPQLAEGWIKRVLRGINPFEQRIQSYRDNQINTIVSMISQAGPRWSGNVPLNQAAADQFGLIEIYETVLQRGRSLSIDGTPPVNYPPANDALLFAAGRIADLYMLLGNEAYADAADPTIAFGTSHGIYGAEAPSIHCFMNQTPSLLEEELALLRGRDDQLLPGVQTYPFYNRLVWNFTSDLNGGEVAYALNYNIRDVNGDVAGSIDEADARLLYPQGHGDAWGHYLTAIKNYYRLLISSNFTWVPRIESVLVGGVPVSVDYLDERKFAQAAAARARTGAEIVNLTYRKYYVEDPQGQYQGYQDSDPERAWGLSEWGSRAGQGAFIDWVVGNAILSPVDTNPEHSGIQKVDRTTVSELRDVLSAYQDIQTGLDNANAGLNPLGLAKNMVPFDIDPALISVGQTHFEQVYGRAVKALNNAISVFNYANNSSQQLRQQADEVADFQQNVMEREADFKSRLVEIFGYPYSDDIGPLGAYATGYDGPDLYHFDYADPFELTGVVPPPGQILLTTMVEVSVDPTGEIQRSTKSIEFHVAGGGFGLTKPPSWTGSRRAPGEIQMARSELWQIKTRFQQAIASHDNLLARIDTAAELLLARYSLDASTIRILNAANATVQDLNGFIRQARLDQLDGIATVNNMDRITDATVEAIPRVVGLSSDVFGAVRGVVKFAEAIAASFILDDVDDARIDELDAELSKQLTQAKTELRLTTLNQEFAELQALRELEQMVRDEIDHRLEVFALREALNHAAGRYLAALARGQRLLEDRLRFRQQTAADVQAYRYKDMAFRIFRNDALQKYRAQFDLAARYVYLAARAYDYETNLRPGDPRGAGEFFLTQIVRARALGLIQNGLPQTGTGIGDGGLADPMARLFQNWDLVLKGQLGFNNPQTETGRFSLRSELFRIKPGSQGTATWRETLARHVVPNLLEMQEFERYCIPFQPQQAVEPAIVIPFSTTINFGLNFFGWPAGGGDNDYDSTHFATKIRSVGVWFANYNNLGGGMINTPRVYLIPVGNDILRSPTSNSGEIREWKILDQALPVPFPLSGGSLSIPGWIPGNDSLIGQIGELRRFARFRAYHDSGNFNPTETINDNRLIGRSVWNSRWLLIIPAGTLHSDREEGINRFIYGALFNGERDGNGVSDIKIFFQTYAYSGN